MTGHLRDMPPHAHADSAILTIDLFYDIGYSEVYFSPDLNRIDTAEGNHSVPCTTLVVRQRDLARCGSESWDQYQEVSLPFDARLCSGFSTGPYDPRNRSKRINMKVTWIGNEDVAIRSIAIRNTTAEHLLSPHGSGNMLREAAVDDTKEFTNRGALTPRWPVIAVAPADVIEQGPLHASSFQMLHKWMRDSLVGFDSSHARFGRVPLWTEGAHALALAQPRIDTLEVLAPQVDNNILR